MKRPHFSLFLLVGTTLFMTTPAEAAPRYSAKPSNDAGVPMYELRDETAQTVVRVAIGFGNNAYSMTVKGTEIMWSPYPTIAEAPKRPTLLGTPFLAPWANRLDHDGFYANGKHYLLNGELGNLRKDGSGQPIHGLISFSNTWKPIGHGADEKGAYVTSRIEFFRQPELMAQFPFAHTIDMTYRLANGELTVETEITNLSFSPMPLVIGYHPYYKLSDAPRDEWTVKLAAKEHVTLNNKLTPTGDRTPAEQGPVQLAGRSFDDVFTTLERDGSGFAEFSVQGKSQKISVLFGPKYNVAVVYAPQGPNRGFICFEPMTGITNGANLAHAGKYPEFQTVPAGGIWKESFRVRPAGF